MPEISILPPRMPFSGGAAEFLFEALAPRRGACDFPRTFAVAPTRQAARSAAAALAESAARREGCGVSGIEFLTPETFMELALPAAGTADRFEESAAMREAVESEGASCAALLPNGPVSGANASALAEKLLRLKSLCAEAGKSFADAAGALEAESMPDARRWRDLARIEERYASLLASCGKADRASALAKAAQNPPIEADRVFLLGVADAPPVFFTMLDSLERGGAEIRAAAFGISRGDFDGWGRPAPGKWARRELEIPDKSIFTPPDRRAQAAAVARRAAEFSGSCCAVSCEDGDGAREMLSALGRAGLEGFSPAGRALSESGVFAFLRALSAYLKSPGFSEFCALMRTGPMLWAVCESSGTAASDALGICDKYRAGMLCRDLKNAIARSRPDSRERALFECADGIIGTLPGARGILETLEKTAFSAPSLDPLAPAARNALRAGLRRAAAAEKSFGERPAWETADELARFCDESISCGARPEGSVPVQNWLEIFWSDAPRLFIADFSGGKVPESASGDAFMPDSLRELLGVRPSSARRNRDAYFAWALLESRKPCGSVEFYAPKADFDGAPLMPSPLLMQTARSSLAARAAALFSETASEGSASAFSSSWKLKVPKAPLPEALSATDFKAYIRCPFEFYIGRVLKMRPFDLEKRELDAMESGTLVHAAFQELAEYRDCGEEGIFGVLSSALESAFRASFGFSPPPAALFQKHFLLQRLRAAARAEAEHRAAGWRTVATETDYGNLSFGGFPVRARIDRIDEGPDGELMVVDYKTIDSPETRRGVSSPEAAHTKARPAPGGGIAWKDLQLPLYAESASRKFGRPCSLAAYFLLPKSADKTRIDVWDISPGQRESALEKAEEIALAIRARSFTPDDASPIGSDYPEIFGFSGEISKFLEFEQ